MKFSTRMSEVRTRLCRMETPAGSWKERARDFLLRFACSRDGISLER